jgi:cyclopropane-fatty-acyl-phospholipid synthase
VLQAAAAACARHLTVQLPDGSTQRSTHRPQRPLPHAALTLHNWNVCSAALKSGDIGFAESYIAGDWTTPNLTDLLKLLIANRKQVEDVIYGTWAGRLLYRIKHLLNRNTAPTARRTSTPTTTWATRSTSCGWTTR